MSDLASFVLNALKEAGALVDSPRYGVYDVVLPDELSRRWQVPAFQRLSVGAEPPVGDAGEEDLTAIWYGHPLVERLIEQVRAEPACVQGFVHGVRTDKRGLLALARQALSFPNARLSEVPRQGEVVAQCHYVRFNFKAALITDEKQEHLVSLVMDVQSGYAVPELGKLEGLAHVQDEAPADRHLPAAVRWLPGHPPRSLAVLEGLLERAIRAALSELEAPLNALERRAARFLELDRARLNEYYDDMVHDLERRLRRAGEGPEDQSQRRTSLQDKLAATESEREAKLADVEAKYRPRLELELINLQFISQHKVLLPVQVGNRTTTVERTVSWDPLLHRVEPLACDVCGGAATRLVLCSGGHLAHESCVLPEQCVDCKRIYCRLCAEQMGRCVVCERPVCLPSLNRCPECGRATCREHVRLCHAAAGEPARLVLAPVPEPSKQQPVPGSASAPPRTREQTRTTPAVKKERKTAKMRPAPPASRFALEAPTTSTPYRIEVYVEPEEPVIHAAVLSQGSKEIAVRSWTWTGETIRVSCSCDRGYACPMRDRVIEPPQGGRIEVLMKALIDGLRQEFGLSPRRVLYYGVLHGERQQLPRLILPPVWKAE
jgi:hypothetical protein